MDFVIIAANRWNLMKRFFAMTPVPAADRMFIAA
jgi:hypothetical protein